MDNIFINDDKSSGSNIRHRLVSAQLYTYPTETFTYTL